MKEPWIFTRCTLVRVIDGDSMKIIVDTGFSHSALVHVRLLGVDTPERGDPENWRLARLFVTNWFAKANTITFECFGPDKYGGRWLGHIINHKGESLGQALIEAKLGVLYLGSKKQNEIPRHI